MEKDTEDFVISSDFWEETKQQEKIQTGSNLMYCPDCGKVISRNAVSCPNCGCVLKKKKPKRIVKRNGFVRFICYATSILGFFVLGAIPALIWGIIFAIYCSGVDETRYNIDYYKSLRRECFIAAIVIFVVNLVLIVLSGRLSLFL